MHEFVDETPSAPSTPSPGGVRGPRVTHESMTIGSLTTRRDDAAASSQEESVPISGAPRGRGLSESAQRMLANIDKHGTVSDTAPSITVEDVSSSPQAPAGAAVAGAATAASPAAVPSSTHAQPAGAAAAPPAPAITAETPTADALAAHRAENERLTAANRKLVAELESRKAAPAREMGAREKLLDEAERTYLDDSVGAIRRLVASAIGADDPKSKEVDDELSSLYQDLTERELSVPLDPARKATKDAARVRQILAREKRERKAETEAASKPAAPAADEQAARATPLIGTRLTARLADGKAIADRFPLMMSLASDLDGLKPEEVVWRVIQRDIAAGRLDPKQSDDKLIEYASNEIETHYQALADKIGKARPQQPSTAAQPQPSTDATAQNADRNKQEVRSITNASASVAPATPPAPKTETPAPTQQPKYRNEKERRAALAAKHFGSG